MNFYGDHISSLQWLCFSQYHQELLLTTVNSFVCLMSYEMFATPNFLTVSKATMKWKFMCVQQTSVHLHV